jgi:hypothetical protein
MPSLEHDSTASSDIDWTYPLTPPPLPSLEVPQTMFRPLTDIPEGLELTPLELPLRQFEDLQVISDDGSGERDELGGNADSNVPDDVEMETEEHITHHTSADEPQATRTDTDSIYEARPTSLPPIDTITDAPPANEDDELDQGEDGEGPENAQNSPASPYFDPEVWKEPDTLQRTRQQRDCAHYLRQVLSRFQSHMLPLTSVRFGSRISHRSFNRINEAIPQSALKEFFPEYATHTDLAKAISSVRADHRKEPNRWQTHIPRIRRIRQILGHLLFMADQLVKSYGYLEGLKEYVIAHDIDFWHADPQGGGLLYTHEYQYLFGFREFLAREEYHEFASRIQ